MKQIALALILLLSMPALAPAPEPKETPAPPLAWEFPSSPRTPTPIPPAAPDAVAKLPFGWTYAVSFPEPCFLLSSPPGVVVFAQNPGPITLAGTFVGGDGKPETKTFQGAVVFSVVGVAGAEAPVRRVELLVVRLKAPNDVARRLVDVGNGPQPPPTPEPITDPLFTPTQAAYSADPSPTKAADKSGLAAVYRELTDMSGISKAGELFQVIQGASNRRIGTRLKPVRAILGAELIKVLPTDPSAALTADHKAKTAALLTRFAAILGEIK